MLVKIFYSIFWKFRIESNKLSRTDLQTSNKTYPLVFITNSPRNYLEMSNKCDHIQFLKVAKTYMKKALTRLAIPLPANLSEIIEMSDGDIRSAINAIKFNAV